MNCAQLPWKISYLLLWPLPSIAEWCPHDHLSTHCWLEFWDSNPIVLHRTLRWTWSGLDLNIMSANNLELAVDLIAGKERLHISTRIFTSDSHLVAEVTKNSRTVWSITVNEDATNELPGSHALPRNVWCTSKKPRFDFHIMMRRRVTVKRHQWSRENVFSLLSEEQ